MTDYILTYTGKRFYPANPQPEQIDLEDIAHALSLQCRFAGHIKRHYSVAQHSVHVAQLVCELENKFWGLFHDAAEAYLCDIPSPIKALLPDYQALERRTMAAICVRFGLAGDMPPFVKYIDSVMLATEAAQLKPQGIEGMGLTHQPLRGFKIPKWTPKQSKHEFLNLAEQLGIK